ncbi:hypothetical protein ACWG0P_02265 [Amedibacillus sp. YH-ame6]
MGMIKKVFRFQKDVLSIKPDMYIGGREWLFCFMFCFINLPVALVVCVCIFMFKIYDTEDSVFLKASKKFKIFNVYLSGYILFGLTMLVFFCIFMLIGLPLRLITTGNLDGVFSEMFMFTMKDSIEILFCICLYQFSVFYMLVMKNKKDFTNTWKLRLFMMLLSCCGLVFFFARIWILENDVALNMMYALVCVSVFALPITACTFNDKIV